MEREVITRLGGREVVDVAIYKEGDANAVEVADAVKARMEVLAKQMPKGISMEVLFDQSRFIKQSISEVRSNAVLGAILAVFILFVFLRDGRSTFIIGLSIPISIMFTFVMMRQLGVSLNLMSLGGLALGVGMLVDNSIVVLESISRHKDRGVERALATAQGAGEVSRAVIASTLTTVAVFLPIVFVEGIAGQVFKDQALTVSVSLMASLVVSLMLIPMVSALSIKAPTLPPELAAQPSRRKLVRGLRASGRFLGTTVPTRALRGTVFAGRRVGAGLGLLSRPVLSLFNGFYERIEAVYRPALDWALAHRGPFLASVLAVFLVSLWATRFIGRELIPQFSQGEFSFAVELPEGSPLSATDSKLARMEELTEGVDGVESYFVSVGTTSRAGSNVKSKDLHRGQINVVMDEKGHPDREERLIDTLRKKYADVDGVELNFSRPTFFTFQTPIEVHVFGYNLDVLKAFSDQVASRMRVIPGVKDVATSMEYGNPELDIEFDRVRLSSLGLSLGEVSNTIKTKIKGEVPTRFKEREKQVDIRVRTSAWRSNDIDAMRGLVVGEHGGTPILLSTVAAIGTARGLNQISRISQQRAAVVSANIDDRDLGGVSDDIRSMLASIPIPPEVTVEMGGQNEELQRSYRSLQLALLLAVFLVYLVMAAQFESFLHPFIILFTVPLGAIGVIVTLLAFQKSLSVVVFIGVIMLAGIVVNNAIVLIDYINQRRRAGAPVLDAVREAAGVRLRPILMTTLTTVLGLLPMALGLGEGAEIRSPMALTVIGGLLGATVLTLLVIPALYTVVTRD
jgi:HAE1 family hydrophobic/amphiphilic exporter-1